MSKKIKIFNYEIIKHKVPLCLYNDKLLKKDVENIFNNKFVLNNRTSPSEKNGKGYSTCGFNNTIVTGLTNINPLLDHISQIILKEFYCNIKNKKIFYNRMWINKIYKNCSGECHTHEGNNDGTAIFYLNVPKNGSKLIILKEFIKSLEAKKNHKHISHYIDVKTGDLILHKKNVPHAVSKHMSDEPRICFIFDFKLIDDPNYNNLNYA